MQTLQRKQAIVLTLAAGLWLILAVSTFITGEYREMPTWRVWLEVALGLFATGLLWEIWKPGGSGRT
jgi:hypothetical protein